MAIDRIALSIPARSEYARTVRMAAAALASRAGMTYDDVEDVRMATQEAFIYAVATLPKGANVEFEFRAGDEALETEVAVGGGSPDLGEETERRAAYAAFILDSVCDSFEFSSDESGARLRLVKLVASAEVDTK
jgi:anti-sigma regulatory factor (Ser/Thr protein kinase)